MTIWILTLLVVGGTVGLGWRQGVIRASFSFVGIIMATLLAALLGRLIKPLLHHVGLPNETMAWMVAPIVGFLIVLTVFKMMGNYFHRQSEVHHKHKVSELELSIWTRLNHRLGLCVGVLNGTAYMVLLAFIIFNLGFWTVQVASSETEPVTTRVLNNLAKDGQTTGLNKVAPSVGVLPADYYRLANLAGLLAQNPDLSARMARYPMFLSLLERDDIQQIVSDGAFTNDWATHASTSQMLHEPAVQGLIHNNDLINIIWSTVETNMDDLNTFLQTGKSPKYDPEPLLGTWDFNVRITFAYLRLTEPNISSSEMGAAKAWMSGAYAQTILIVAADNQAYLKYWPDVKAKPQRGQPLPTINYKGQWSVDGTNYTFNLSNGSDTKTFNGAIDGQRLLMKDDKSTYAFDHE